MHKDSDLIRRGDARARARDAFKEGAGAVDDALNDCAVVVSVGLDAGVDERFARTFDASFVMPDGSERPAITNACGNPAPAPPEKFYGGRDLVALDKAGNYFCRHVSAMTSEGLHSKADIAAELAWRDQEIDRLKREVATAYDRGRLDEFRRGHTCVVCSCELMAHDAAPFCRDSCRLDVEDSEGAESWLDVERELDRAREAAR